MGMEMEKKWMELLTQYDLGTKLKWEVIRKQDIKIISFTVYNL